MGKVDFDGAFPEPDGANTASGAASEAMEQASQEAAQQAAPDAAAGASEASGLSARKALKSLLTAGESGPQAPTLREAGLGGGVEHVADGLTDWILDLVSAELGDTLGPLGKMGRGVAELATPPASGNGDGSADSDGGSETERRNASTGGDGLGDVPEAGDL